MDLEVNEHILENKELKTNSQKRRFISINNTTDSFFSNGLVTIIHQEQFNQLKEEYNSLKANDENPITEDDLQQLQEQIQQLKEENHELKSNNEELAEELKETSFKLDLAINNNELEEVTSSKDETISILKEDKAKIESEVASYKDKAAALEEEINSLKDEHQININQIHKENKEETKKLSDEITTLKVALAKAITEYEHLKNRSFFQRLRNKNTVELSNYNKLIENKPVYTIETKLDE